MNPFKTGFLIAFAVLMVGSAIAFSVGVGIAISSVTGLPAWVSVPVLLLLVWLAGRRIKSPKGTIGGQAEKLLLAGSGGPPPGDRPASRDTVGEFLVKYFPLRGEPGRFDLPKAARYYGLPLLPALRAPRYSPEQVWALNWTSHRLEHATFGESPCSQCASAWTPANRPVGAPSDDELGAVLRVFDDEQGGPPTR